MSDNDSPVWQQVPNGDIDPFWLLRVPVRQGDCTPFELMMLYHAGTLLPLQRESREQLLSREAA